MPDEETREEPEVEGHGIEPRAAAAEAAGVEPAATDDLDDVEAHMFGDAGVEPKGVEPQGVEP